MRSRVTTWFETTINHEKADDLKKGIKPHLYIVDAFSFSEAEIRATEEVAPYVSGDFAIKKITKANFSEVFFSDKETDDRWYKVRLMFITLDEKTEKEKESAVNYLFQGQSVAQVVNYVIDVMKGTAIDYKIYSVTETKIDDVFEHKAQNAPASTDDKPEYEQ